MLSDVIESYGGEKMDPLDVYKDIFRIGEGFIQKEYEDSGSYKANPIAYYKNENEDHGHFRIMFEDKFEDIYRNELVNADFCVMNGLTYFGAKYTSDRASKMCAMIFDIDGVTDKSLNNFFYAAFNKEFDYYPLPNYVALSGHGIHLYYVFEEPVPLFPNLKLQLKEFKYSLTEKMWNKNTSVDEKVQKQGINQPFRILGGKCKKNAPLDRVEVYRVNQQVMNQQIIELNDNITDTTSLNALYEAKRKELDLNYRNQETVLKEQIKHLSKHIEYKENKLNTINKSIKSKQEELDRISADLRKKEFWINFKNVWINKWIAFASAGFLLVFIGGFLGWPTYKVMNSVFKIIRSVF